MWAVLSSVLFSAGRAALSSRVARGARPGAALGLLMSAFSRAASKFARHPALLFEIRNDWLHFSDRKEGDSALVGGGRDYVRPRRFVVVAGVS